jgi:hypothetical protein
MNENVTVDEAIAKGHRLINYPGFIIFFGTIGLGFYFGIQNIFPYWIIPVSFGLGFCLSWLWWSIKITKWRIWAFENVRNVHELQKRAIQEKLIWSENSLLSKTEIRSKIDNERLNLLKTKFEKEDLFEDDLSTPHETIIYYSKEGNYIEMVIMLLLMGFGIYLLIQTDNYIIGTIFSILGAYFSINEYRQATDTNPQIIINDKGIWTISTEFYEWSDIENEEVINNGLSNNNYCYLFYEHPNGMEFLQIEDFETDQRSLNKLLIVYRGRNKKINKS